MAHFLRLISFALALLLSNSAFAAIEPIVEYKAVECPYGGDFPTSWTSSREAACGQMPNACAERQGAPGNYIDFVEGSGCQIRAAGGGTMATIGIETRGACPANSISNGSGGCVCATNYQDVNNVCVRTNPCPAGQHEEGGACVPDNCKADEIRVNGLCVKEPECEPGQTRVNGVCKQNGCKAGKSAGMFDEMPNDTSPGYFCNYDFDAKKFCAVKAQPSICVTYDGKTSCSGTGRYTGGACAPTDDPSGKPPKPEDPPGPDTTP